MNTTQPDTPSFGRRGLFRIGGLTVASAAAIAACGKSEAGETGNIGVGEDTPKLPAAVVNNGVHMRTLAGIEQSIVAAYGRMIDGGFLSEASAAFPDVDDLSQLVAEYAVHHREAADALNVLAQDQGVEPWECGNTRLDSAFINVVFDRVENGALATDQAAAIAPSDDPTRDMLNLVHTLESLSAASCQGAVPQVSEPALRAALVAIGVTSARQAALFALRLNPGGYVATGEDAQPAAETTTSVVQTTQNIATPDTGDTGGVVDVAPGAATTIPLPVAMPSQFGSLAPIVYIGGAGDENGVRLKLNFETPSFNSFAYTFDACP